MKTLYLDIFSGISGDMFMGAMLDLGVELRQVEQELAKLSLGGFHLHAHSSSRESIKCVACKSFRMVSIYAFYAWKLIVFMGLEGKGGRGSGFWSYGLLWAIKNQNAFFALRLKSDVKLATLKQLGNGERLVRWTPKDSRGNWRKAGLPRSIDLRVIEYRVPGFRRQAIVTNVLSQKAIPREDWTRLSTSCQDAHRKLSVGLFHRRWEIETSYYEMKVDQGMEGQLHSRVPESIAYEIAGHVVLYLLVRWLMVEAAVKHGLDPLRLSFLEAFRELDLMRSSLLTSSPQWVRDVLLPRLLDRIAEHQVPERPGRHYPRRKKSKKSDNKKKSHKKPTKPKAKNTKPKPHKKFVKQG